MKQDCLPIEDLRRVISGELPPDDFDSAIAHLDDCDRCRSAAESLHDESQHNCSPANQTSKTAADSDEIDRIQNETACQVAVGRLLQTNELGNANVGASQTDGTSRRKLGPYLISGSLGSGGMGTVMLGQHERLKRDCAIKLLPRERVHSPGWLDRFEREMAAVAALEHPNIVRATDAGHEDGWHYLVMEHLDGLDVGRIARRINPMEIADACEIIRQAACGLAAIHDAGLVHRDIKPSNLMLTRSGIVKVLDLGLVLSGDDPICVDDRLTTVGHLMGTVAFMSPEQLADSRHVDARADVYSLGATFYRLVGGRTTHHREGGLAKQILAITNNNAPPIQSIRDDVPHNVAALIDQMLARDPSHRPATAAEVADRLTDAVSASRLKKLVTAALRTAEISDAVPAPVLQPSATPPVSPAAVPPKSRWPKRIALALGGAAILIAAIVFKITTDVGDLVIHSDADNLTITVSQNQQVVRRLKIGIDQQNRTTLRKGTYRIAIEGGGDALRLSDEVVTIGRGTQSPIRIDSVGIQSIQNRDVAHDQVKPTADPDNQKRLYRGQTLEHYLAVLTNDADVKTVADAMVAAELLSRGTKERSLAAAETLKIARQWGSLTSTGSTDTTTNQGQTDLFMTALLSTFPAYEPDTVFQAIASELQSGNRRSAEAAVFLLNNFRNGWNETEGNRIDLQREAVETVETIASQKHGRESLEIIERALINQIDANAPVTMESKIESGMRRETALWLHLAINETVAKDSWASAYVSQTIAERQKAWQEAESGDLPSHTYNAFGTGTVNAWGCNEDLLLATIRSGHADKVSSEFLCDVFLDKWYEVHSHRSGTILEFLTTHHRDVLLARFDNVLRLSEIPTIGHWSSLLSPPTGTSFESDVAILLADKRAARTMMLPFYADQAEPTEHVIDLMGRIRDRLKAQGADHWLADPYKPLDSAITMLSQRFEAQHGKPPKPTNERFGFPDSLGIESESASNQTPNQRP